MIIDTSTLSPLPFHLQKPKVAWHNSRAVKALGYRSFSPKKGAPMQPSQQFRDLFAGLPSPLANPLHRRKHWPGLEGLTNKNRDHKQAIRSVQFAAANLALLESANILKAVARPGEEIRLKAVDGLTSSFNAKTARGAASAYARYSLLPLAELLALRASQPALIFPLNMRSYFSNAGTAQREHELSNGDWLRWTMHFAKWAEVDLALEFPPAPEDMTDIVSLITLNAVSTIKDALDYMVNYNNFVWNKAVLSWLRNYGRIRAHNMGDFRPSSPVRPEGVAGGLALIERLAGDYGPAQSQEAVVAKAARDSAQSEGLSEHLRELAHAKARHKKTTEYQLENRLKAMHKVKEQREELMRLKYSLRDHAKIEELREAMKKIMNSKAKDWPLSEAQVLEIAGLFPAEKIPLDS